MLYEVITLHIGKEGDPNFQPVDNTIFKRLAQSKKGSEISKMIGQNIDARHILQAWGQSSPVADQVASRLRQPEWSAPVITSYSIHYTKLYDEFGDAPCSHAPVFCNVPEPLAFFSMRPSLPPGRQVPNEDSIPC